MVSVPDYTNCLERSCQAAEQELFQTLCRLFGRSPRYEHPHQSLRFASRLRLI